MKFKKKNRKGQLFTIIALLLITLMFVSVEVFSLFDQEASVKTRVSTMDSFLNSLEENLERQIYISGFRTIFLAESEIISTGIYVSNVTDFFNEAFFNGTVNGVPNNSILTGATYDDLVDSVQTKAGKINVDIVMTNPVLTVGQSDPWNVNLTLSSDFLMTDKSNLVRWEKKQKISALIPVTFFDDPIFALNSFAKVSRRVNMTPYEGSYSSGGSVVDLDDHVSGHYYAENPFAPSFLKRLEGDLTADPNGIESFVDISELSAQGISTHDKTVIDYIYFSTNNPASHSVSGMPGWFKIDSIDNHTVKYGV